MKKINLREIYPDVYTTDFFVEVTEDVIETIQEFERAEAAYRRKIYRYKAQYSLDCENGIENAVLPKPQTLEMLLEEKQFQKQVYGFLVRGTSFDHCGGNTLKDRNGLRAMLDAVENNLVEAVIVRDLEQISRNSYLLVGVIEIFRRRNAYLITTECDLNTELINCGLERFAGDRFTRASFGKPRFDVRLPLMDQF